ncbi:outer membrane beta-barrel protein [Winogradskyella psychrotolerans]|uniref:outer membrane beta-barrel protein n=1 Tax=Winogradskyella psychrotolerans TaxID=1344585 RepID=UPI001C06FFA5|nr:outer membrane beta-barrel protein [Winogradskyella psychrotolerans]MBU2927630.1 outer membrane beta-barrel protein [Winogradskyella psychrotolerans]
MKTLFFFLVLTISLSLNAQITKGNWLVGGSGSFTSTTATSEDNLGNEFESIATALQLRPNIGYFLTDKFATGLNIGVNLSNSPGRDNSNWSMSVGPFARYYFLKPENRVNLFGEASFSYGNGLSEINKDRNTTSYGFSTGGVLFFNSSVGLEMSLNYTDSTSRSDGSSDTNFKNLFLGLGFQIHLEK